MHFLRRTGAVLAVTLFLAGWAALPAAAQDEAPAGNCEVPAELDAELVQQFQDELVQMLTDAGAGTLDPSLLLGEAGQFDLPPGSLVVDGIAPLTASGPCPEKGGGSSLTGPCMGVAMSFDGDGEVIDAAADFDPAGAPVDLLESTPGNLVRAFDRDNPFKVDVNGFVAYTGVAGTAGNGPRNHSWSISTFGGVELDSGGDPNVDGKNRNAGSIDLGSDLPAAARVNALFTVEGEMTADNGFVCQGSGYFETVGGAPVLEITGTVILIGAGLGALFNARPARTWSA